MRVSVIGCGYLGAVHAAAHGRTRPRRRRHRRRRRQGRGPRAGRGPVLRAGPPRAAHAAPRADGCGSAPTSPTPRGAAVHFVAVGTPQQTGGLGRPALRRAAIDALLPILAPGDVVVGKSTVPVGTAAAWPRPESRRPGATLVWNPEFLREGHAIRDTLEPDRLVYGVARRRRPQSASTLLDEVYASRSPRAARSSSPTSRRPNS